MTIESGIDHFEEFYLWYPQVTMHDWQFFGNIDRPQYWGSLEGI
jgi:hypothetical protein